MANTLKNVRQKSIGVDATTLYTTPGATTTIVIGMTAANILSASNVDIDVTLHDSAGDAGTHIVKGATIAPGGALVPIGGDQKVIMETGHIMKAVSSDSDSIDIIMSIVEQT
jgi:hypothetical protein